MKKILVVVLTLFSVMLLASCSTNGTFDGGTRTDQEEVEDELLELTIEQLAMYNGEDGNPSYIAFNGVIYDITNNGAWSGGSHRGVEAGTDISDVIGDAPHGEDVLEDLEVVGEIVE